jgi:hypothetical protein
MSIFTSLIKPTTGEENISCHLNLLKVNYDTNASTDTPITLKPKAGAIDLRPTSDSTTPSLNVYSSTVGERVKVAGGQILCFDASGTAGVQVTASGETFFRNINNSAQKVTLNTAGPDGDRRGISIGHYGYRNNDTGFRESRSLVIRNEAGTDISSLGPNAFIATNRSGGTMFYVTADGNGSIAVEKGGGGSSYFTFKKDGTATCQNWNSSSDSRYKEQIETLLDGVSDSYFIDKISSLRPVSFVRKTTQRPEFGFLAQEVQSIIPTAITEQAATNLQLVNDELIEFDNGTELVMNYNCVVAVLAAAVKQLSAKVAALEAAA